MPDEQIVPIMAPQTLEDFHRRVAALEKLERDGASIEVLTEAVRDLNRGCRTGMPPLEVGKILYRAVRVDEKPYSQSRISYPPVDRIGCNGRLNLAGEALFYSSLPSRKEVPTFDIGCLYECQAQPGERYAVGEWIVTKPMLLSHMGFARDDFEKSFRARQPWMNVEDPNPVISDIRRWQSNAITRFVAPGDNHLYRLSIALARFCMREFPPSDGFSRPSGIIYPSVATRFNTDNVALLPAEVDRALRLRGAWYIRIVGEKQFLPLTDCIDDPVGRMDVYLEDWSSACLDNGEIMWSKRGTNYPASWTHQPLAREPQ